MGKLGGLPARILLQRRGLGDFIGVDREVVVPLKNLTRLELLALDSLHSVFLASDDYLSICIVTDALHSVYIVLCLRVSRVLLVEPLLGPGVLVEGNIVLFKADFHRACYYSLVPYREIPIVLEGELNPTFAVDAGASDLLVCVKFRLYRQHK